MRWLEKIRMQLEMLLHRRREGRRLDAELKFHLEQQIAENIAAGMSREEAGYAARRTFGNPTLLGEQAREAWSWNSTEVALQNIRISLRTLARTPGFAFISILVIAIGIGANVALFTVVRSVLLKPLPFKEPARLLRLYEHSADDKNPYNQVAAGIFAEWKKQSHSFSDLALVSIPGEYNMSGEGGQLPESVRAVECSWDLFPALGVEPAVGRRFTAADDKPSVNGTVILSWGLWNRRFGSDRAILNQTIHLSGKSYTVIGVMPPWFAYPEQSVQLWTPIYHEESAQDMQALDSHDYVAIGRLEPGISESRARTELSIIVRRIHDQHLDNPFVSKAVQRQLNRADREASSIQSSIVTPMTVYDDPIVQRTVSRSDFVVRDLVYGEEPMSLYFKVPQPDRERLRPLVRLMLQLIFNRLMERLDPSRHHLLLMLDEFPELKKIPNLAGAMSLMAGYKIKPYLIAQTLTQIIEEYGPNESITDNCYIKAAFQTDNLQTCKNLSELSGNMTVEKETVNYSGQRTDFYLKHIFRSVEQVQRPLITVDEIRRIKPPTKASNDPDSKITAPGDMLIFINGVAPIYGVQSLYFLNDALLARTKLKPPAFKTASEPHAQPAPVRQAALDIGSIAAAAIDQQAIEEKLNGNS